MVDTKVSTFPREKRIEGPSGWWLAKQFDDHGELVSSGVSDRKVIALRMARSRFWRLHKRDQWPGRLECRELDRSEITWISEEEIEAAKRRRAAAFAEEMVTSERPTPRFGRPR